MTTPQTLLSMAAAAVLRESADLVEVSVEAWSLYDPTSLTSPATSASKALREVATMYDLDGLQLDFARHVPCLPVGRQWELRGHVTELMRMARRFAST